MARDPALLAACEAVTAALAAGEPVDAAHLVGHLAACPTCRARAALVEALAAPPAPPTLASRPLPGPDATRLATAVRARRVRRAVVTTTALAAVVLAVVLGTRAAPEPPPPDLFAVLDDVDRAVAPTDLPGEDLLALVDPTGEDPLAAADPLVDALLGEGSL